MKKKMNYFSNQSKVLDTILKNKRNNITKKEIENLTPNKIKTPLIKEESNIGKNPQTISHYEEDKSNSMILNLEKYKEEVVKNKEPKDKKEELQPKEEYLSKFIDKSLYINQKYKEKVKKQTEELTKAIKTKNPEQEEKKEEKSWTISI